MAVGCRDGAPGLPVPCGGKRLRSWRVPSLSTGCSPPVASSHRALPESWGVQGSPIPAPSPPLGTVPCYSEAQGTPRQGDNHRSTVPSSGSLTVPGEAAVPGQKQPWHSSLMFSMRPQPCRCRIRTTWPLSPPRLCSMDGSSPPGLFGEKIPRGGTGRWPTRLAHRPGIPVRHGGMQPAPVPSRPGMWRQRCRAVRRQESCQGRASPGAEKHEKAEVFPHPAVQTGKGEGKEGRGSRNARPSPAPPRREGDAP